MKTFLYRFSDDDSGTLHEGTAYQPESPGELAALLARYAGPPDPTLACEAPGCDTLHGGLEIC